MTCPDCAENEWGQTQVPKRFLVTVSPPDRNFIVTVQWNPRLGVNEVKRESDGLDLGHYSTDMIYAFLINGSWLPWGRNSSWWASNV
jgi:hypothetical protein